MSLLSIDEMVAKGWGRCANTGAFTDGVQGGGAGNVILIDEPEMVIGVPAGVCIRPIRVAAQVQIGAVTTDADEAEILVAVDSLGLWRGDGTTVAETPTNMRTDLDKGSVCRVGSACTGALTTVPGFAVYANADPVLDIELARRVVHIDVATAANNLQMILDLDYQPKYPPYLVGPCSLFVYMGGTVNTVDTFCQVQWVEGPVSDMLPAA